METKDLIELVDFFAALAVAIDQSREDGKLDLNDAQNFFPAFFLAPNAFSGLKNVPADWKVIKENDAARLSLTNRFREKFDLRDDVAEADIELAVEGVVTTLTAVSRLVKPITEEDDREAPVEEPAA